MLKKKPVSRLVWRCLINSAITAIHMEKNTGRPLLGSELVICLLLFFFNFFSFFLSSFYFSGCVYGIQCNMLSFNFLYMHIRGKV